MLVIYAIAQNKVVLEITDHFIISFVIRLFWSQNFKHRTYGGWGLRLLIVDQSIINILYDQSTVPDLILSYGIGHQPFIKSRKLMLSLEEIE